MENIIVAIHPLDWSPVIILKNKDMLLVYHSRDFYWMLCVEDLISYFEARTSYQPRSKLHLWEINMAAGIWHNSQASKHDVRSSG